jgi:hypothetical protein
MDVLLLGPLVVVQHATISGEAQEVEDATSLPLEVGHVSSYRTSIHGLRIIARTFSHNLIVAA